MSTFCIFLTSLATADWIGIVGLAVMVIGAIIVLIFQAGGIYNSVNGLKAEFASLKANVDKIPAMEVKVDEMWRFKTTVSASPMVLNDYGKKILKDSEIEKITDKYYADILVKVKALNPKNPFQAQEILIDVVKALGNDPDCQILLQDSAFKSGTNTDTVLFVAAINIRDKIISELGFSKDDIDKHDPKKAIK